MPSPPAPPARVRLLLGAPGTGRTQTLLRLLLEDSAAGPKVAQAPLGGAPGDGLLLVPGRATATRLQRWLEERTPTDRPAASPVVRTPAALAYGVLRQDAAARGEPPPRLLTGAEQDVVLADLLAGHREHPGTGPRWPTDLVAAVPTADFRDQLRDLLMRAVEHGLDPDGLAGLAAHHDRPDWAAAAQVLREYDEVTALQSPGTYDPAWICTAAAEVVERSVPGATPVPWTPRLLLVDDAQELTAAAARLITAFARLGTAVVLAGDGDVATERFRGADPGRFVRLADELAGPDGPHVEVLSHRHRMSAAVSEASGRLVATIGASSGTAHRRPTAAGEEGSLEVALTRTPGAEAALVAARLRRAHLGRGVPWSQLAVLGRSRGTLDRVRRALVSAGVPVRDLPSTGPLRDLPAVSMLTTAYSVAVGSQPLTAGLARRLVDSPLGGADPAAVRALRRRLRDLGTDDVGEALRELVETPQLADPLGPDAAPAARVGRVLAAGRAAAQEPEATAESVLWAVWEASGLAARWRRQALAGGPLGARADRDLDAVLLLFAAAADYVDRLPGRGPEDFVAAVAAREVTADSRGDRTGSPEAVELLTPQAARGRQWRQVAVVGVQEGQWPDLRLRDTLLGSQALVAALQGRPAGGPEGVRAAARVVRHDETRLLLLALTRAEESVLVTAVADGERAPSGLLEVLDPGSTTVDPVDLPPELSLRGVVGHLRRQVALAHRTGDHAARAGWAARLARLAAADVAGADPREWWSAREVSASAPLRGDVDVVVSPSRVQLFEECALRWLLSTRGGDGRDSSAAAVGVLVHDLVSTHPDAPVEELETRLLARWSEAGAGAGWVAERARARAVQMLRHFVGYRRAALAAGRELVGTEVDLDATVAGVRVVGRVDRVERDAHGRTVVVDLKTGASKPAGREVARHAQLGVYQAAVAAGGIQGSGGAGDPVAALSGGAALVHLGRASGAEVSVQQQPPLDTDPESDWPHELLRRTAEGMAAARFPATVGGWCRTCPVRASCPAQPEGAPWR